MRRWFSCPNFQDGLETRLCDTQYYFWDVEDCGTMANTLPYICKRAADKIGNYNSLYYSFIEELFTKFKVSFMKSFLKV